MGRNSRDSPRRCLHTMSESRKQMVSVPAFSPMSTEVWAERQWLDQATTELLRCPQLGSCSQAYLPAMSGSERTAKRMVTSPHCRSSFRCKYDCSSTLGMLQTNTRHHSHLMLALINVSLLPHLCTARYL
jgi:hypothetical protein